MFLTEAELRQLTGKSRHTAQIRWLQRERWRFTVNALGAPVVANAEASRKLVGGATKRTQEPDWESLNGKAS
jgi:hypothetical protein